MRLCGARLRPLAWRGMRACGLRSHDFAHHIVIGFAQHMPIQHKVQALPSAFKTYALPVFSGAAEPRWIVGVRSHRERADTRGVRNFLRPPRFRLSISRPRRRPPRGWLNLPS